MKLFKNATTVKTVTGRNVLGVLPGIVIFTLVCVLVWAAFRDKKEEPSARRARIAAEEKQNMTVQHGEAVAAATEVRTLEQRARERSDLEKGESISAEISSKPTTKSASAEGNASAESVLRALEGMEETAQADPIEAGMEEQGGDMRSMIENFISPSQSQAESQKKVDRKVARASGGSTGSAGTERKAISVTVFKADPVLPPPPPPTPSGYERSLFLPLGATIKVYFLQNVESTQENGLIELGVAEDVYDVTHGKVLIPFGTSIYATGGARALRDRMMLQAGTIVYFDRGRAGQEAQISGVLMDDDETVGVRGYWKSHVLPKVTPYINQFAAAWVAALQDRRMQVLASSDGIVAGKSAGDLALQEASKAITNSGDAIQKQIASRYQDYLLVPKGTPAIIRLTAAADLSKSARGASDVALVAAEPAPDGGDL